MSTDQVHARPSDADPAAEPEAPRHRGHALRRALISLLALALVLAALLAGGFFFLENRYAGNISRVKDVFAGVSNRPAPPSPNHAESAPPVTFLLMGSDTRAHPASGTLPDGRSDVIMIVRLTGDRQHAQVISIPRDSWVNIPGYGMNKINASYAFGGPSLLIQTVEQVTGVRIDHFAAMGFDGLIKVTDDLGGVDVQVAQSSSNGPYTFHAGLNHLNGDQAMWYLRERYDLPGGDFDREKRHQQYLRSMFQKLFSGGTFNDLGRLDSVLRTITGSVSLDDAMSNNELLSLAYSMRSLTPGNVQYFTSPVLGTGMEGAASVVYLDQNRGDRMWGYLKSDSLAQNASEFGADALTAVPR